MRKEEDSDPVSKLAWNLTKQAISAASDEAELQDKRMRARLKPEELMSLNQIEAEMERNNNLIEAVKRETAVAERLRLEAVEKARIAALESERERQEEAERLAQQLGELVRDKKHANFDKGEQAQQQPTEV